jgi:hypothetical protein
MIKKLELLSANREDMSITLKVNCFITPRILMYKEKKYEIIKILNEFIIKEYEIKLKDRLLEYVKFKNPHPNKHPNTNIFCIQEFFKQNLFELDSDLEILEHQFLIHNYDGCYNKYWYNLEYVTPTNSKDFSLRIHNEKQMNNKLFDFDLNNSFNYEIT